MSVSGLRRFRSIVFAGCAVLILSSAVAQGQTFKITNVTSNSASKASFPTMVVDGSGTLNVARIDSVNGIQFARSTSAAGGTALGAPVTIPGSNGQALPAFQPQIAVFLNAGPTPHIEIVWAALDPASTSRPPTYDVFASRSDQSGAAGSFTTTPIAISTTPTTPTGVPLADSPRLSFDTTGAVNIVWGQNNVWISQSVDGIHFPNPPIPLMPANTPVDTGGPRIAVDAAGNIFVAWTDESGKNQAGSYCTGEVIANGSVTNGSGGNFWINETFPSSALGGPLNISATNTRNLSINDWKGPSSKFPLGFFGCSYDNLGLFLDGGGRLHLLWSDDSPFEDVLTSENHGNRADGFTLFSFPINLANVPAASPSVAVDKNGSFYVVWSGGPTGGTGSEGTFFSRSDDGGSTFTSPALKISSSGAVSPAFPQVAVDSNGNVNVAWEQPTAALKGDGSDMFNVFFARSNDRGNTFPTVLQVSTSPSVFCFKNPPPPQGDGTLPTTADVSTCGTVRIGVDASSTPDMVWVSQASGSAIADMDFATATFPTGSISPSSASLSASNASANFTVTVSQAGFPGPITFSCINADTGAALPSWLTCTFNPQPLDPTQSNTDTLKISRVGTPTSSMFLSAPSSRNLPAYSRPLAWSTALTALLLMTMTILVVGRRRERSAAVLLRGLLLMMLTVTLAAGLVSCGGGTSSNGISTSGSGGTGGGGGSSITMHVAILAQSGGSTTNLGTVTINAQ